jgi:hypothetical protein
VWQYIFIDTVCKKIIWTPLIHFLRWKFHNEERIFSSLWLYHSIDRSLYFILEEKNFSFNKVCKNYRRFSMNQRISYAKKLFGHFTFPFIFLLFYIQIFWIIPHWIEKTFLYPMISFRNENNIDKTSKNSKYLKPYRFYRKPKFFSLDEMKTQLKIYHSIENKKLNRMVSFLSRNN